MPSNRPSDELFQSRLSDMIEREGIEGVQARYGVTRRTVRAWASGARTPRSSAVARSVSRTSLRRGYSQQVIQVTDAQGRFTTQGSITDSRAIGYVRAQRERLEDRRNVMIRGAMSESERVMAEAQPIEPDMNFALELQERRRRMLQLGITSDDSYYGPDGWDSWDEWRDDLVGSYEQMAG